MKKILLVMGGIMLGTIAVGIPVMAQNTGSTNAMSFFVTSVGIGKGANLGGLVGADRHCQDLAQAAGAGGRTWHAYLSTSAAGAQPAVNARDRIGQGPWYNFKGARVAQNLAELNGDTIDLARLGNGISRLTALTEKGERLPGAGDPNDRHDMLTGSKADGTAFTDGADHTCKNWTSDGPDGSAQVGHPDRAGGFNTSWNSAHASKGCGLKEMAVDHGEGLFYCFAIDAK